MRGLWADEPLLVRGQLLPRSRCRAAGRVRCSSPARRFMLGGSGNGILRRAGRWADVIHMMPVIGGDGTTTIPTVAAFTDADGA